MSSAGTRRLSPILTVAVLASLAILAAALAYRFWGGFHQNGKEVIKAVQFIPLEGALAERSKFQVAQEVGSDVLSTTLPIRTTYQHVPFQQDFLMGGNPEDRHSESDALLPYRMVPTKGAVIVKFSNSELCDAEGVCPIALMTQSDDESQVRHIIFQDRAKNIWMSNKENNGNPDLIIDYGRGAPLVRMYWDTEGQFPSYQATAFNGPSQTQ